MVDFHHIYSSQADLYELLISREDYKGNLLKALRSFISLKVPMAIDLGTGTGRLIRLLAPEAELIVGMDVSMPMLDQARITLLGSTSESMPLVQGDNLSLPFRSGAADLVLAGWSFGHLTGWYPDDWPALMSRCVEEMQRIVDIGGTAIILETLGTGRESPRPPTKALADYYRFLEEELAFSSTWVRTDYRFLSVAEAVHLTGFFFGDDLALEVQDSGFTILPECTGIWWKRY